MSNVARIAKQAPARAIVDALAIVTARLDQALDRLDALEARMPTE
jgi:hypothetical protein